MGEFENGTKNLPRFSSLPVPGSVAPGASVFEVDGDGEFDWFDIFPVFALSLSVSDSLQLLLPRVTEIPGSQTKSFSWIINLCVNIFSYS